jgi:hypothetical protein
MPMVDPVRFLIKWELRRYPLPLCLTALFFLLMGFMLGSQILDVQQDTEHVGSIFYIIRETQNDWILLAMASVLSYVFTKENYVYHRTDAFTRKLAFYRKLPVDNLDILAARYLILLMNLAIFSVFFYTPFYLMLRNGHQVGGLQFLGSLLVWSGFSLLASSFYVYLELGHSGKTYFRTNLILVALYLVVLTLLAFAGFHIVGETFRAVDRYGLYPSLLSLLAGGIGAYAIFRKTLRRMAARDLA